jgi:tRNA (cytidine/uridine-2'-O-)-methyltransferase
MLPNASPADATPGFHVLFYSPRIPPNTGNAIRMVAATGATLHLIEPLGFDLTDAKLRRAGLDYHDLARVVVHPDLDAALAAVAPGRVYAFTGGATTSFADIRYDAGDALLFGPEPTGLPAVVLADPRITARVRIPMVPGIRSLNLSSSATLAVYEAWRQHAYAGA